MALNILGINPTQQSPASFKGSEAGTCDYIHVNYGDSDTDSYKESPINFFQKGERESSVQLPKMILKRIFSVNTGK